MFFALQVDRGNLVQAVSDTMLKDLDLTTNGESSTTIRLHFLHNLSMNPTLTINNTRLQLWQYRLPRGLPMRRASIATGIEETRPR